MEVFIMATNSVKRDYNMTDAELCMFTSNLCNTMTRDLSDLSVFGITAAKIAALKALGDEFEIYPSDEVLSAYVVGATEAKNVLANAVKESIRNMVTRCEIKWGPNSWQEKSLGVKGLNAFSDESLLSASRRVHTQMVAFLSQLADTGLTQAMLDDMEALNNSFEVAKNEQFTKIAERDSATEIRIKKGNEIYKYITKYCEIGKRVYAKTNPAKYDDYVIYAQGSISPLSPPQNFAYSLENTDFTWDAVANATSYQIEKSLDQVNWEEIYVGSETVFDFTPSDPGFSYFRCRARNAGGFGDYSNIVTIEYYPVLPKPQNVNAVASGPTGTDIIITFDLVPTATAYWLYESAVPLGAQEGGFSFKGSYSGSPITRSVTAGKRYYYKLKAVNQIQQSEATTPIYIDIP